MAVPEAAVNEANGTVATENEIRRSGETADVESESKLLRVKCPSKNEFGLGVLVMPAIIRDRVALSTMSVIGWRSACPSCPRPRFHARLRERASGRGRMKEVSQVPHWVRQCDGAIKGRRREPRTVGLKTASFSQCTPPLSMSPTYRTDNLQQESDQKKCDTDNA